MNIAFRGTEDRQERGFFSRLYTLTVAAARLPAPIPKDTMKNGCTLPDGKMVSPETKSVIDRAKRIYAEHLRTDLESDHRNRFVAIEPESGDWFLGDTFDEAVNFATAKHPDRVSHTIRIGHRAAFHIGVLQT